ncbi:MAG: hypothetical protein ACO3A4_12145 [Silvanigrellaceae bacterium]
MKRVLTHFRRNRGVTRLLPALFAMIGGVAQAEDSTTASNPSVDQVVKVRSQTFENRRFGQETMTWVVQKTEYEDGTTVLTLAGAQFEESFGLTVALLDEAVPTKTEALLPTGASEQASGQKPTVIEDGFKNPDNETSGSSPRLHVNLRSLLVDIVELKQKPALKQTIPLCENGQRRAIVYLRAVQLGRQLELNTDDAQTLSRLARAACVRWEGVPSTISESEVVALKNSSQTAVPSQPDAVGPKN